MKNEGKLFEQDWKSSCDNTGFCYMRLRDGAKWIQGAGSSFTPENPCDSILHTAPFMWLLELKSTKGASVSFNPREPWKKPDSKRQVMIKHNQVKELMELTQSHGVMGGFIINYRPRELKSGTTDNKVFFVHINDFVKFATESGKSSISITDCMSIGTEIGGEKKKVRYKYGIEDFCNRAIVNNLSKIPQDFLVSIRNYIDILINAKVKRAG